MRKISIVLGCLFLLGGLSAQAQATSELWDGNLTNQQVISKLHKCEMLPLFFNDFGAFESATQKASVAKIASEQAARCNSYAGYFNAAVVYFARSSRLDGDSFISLNGRDAANAAYFASKALEINPNAIQMLFLRGMVYVEQGAEWNDARTEYIIRSRKDVLYALEDFEQVARLNSSKAPYVEMSLLKKALKKQEKMMRHYQQIIKDKAIKRHLKKELSRRQKPIGKRPHQRPIDHLESPAHR